jgi:hypothetical protein
MKIELMKLPNGEELTRDELIERESYITVAPPLSLWKERARYIGFNVLCFSILAIVCLLCPKCSDADDRAIGLPKEAISK